MQKTIGKRLTRYELIISLLLIGICGYLAHGVLIGRLGFYKEDWYVIWSGLTQGVKSLIPLFQRDRPPVGYLYAIVYPILGANPLAWQIYTLTIRLLGAYTLYWLLSFLWPRQRYSATVIAILFVVYPGFVQQPQANTYMFHLTPFGLAILSITLTIYAYQTSRLSLRLPALIVSMILAALYPLLMEYYIGMEGLRVLLVWYITHRDSEESWLHDIKNLVVRLSPYLLSAGVFLYWRLFIFKSTRPTTDVDRLYVTYLVGGWHMLFRFVIEWGRDFVETVWLAWTIPFERNLYWGSYRDLLLGALLALLGMGLYLFYEFLIKPKRDEIKTDPSMHNAMIWLGALSVFIALAPHLAANRDVRFDLFNRLDRYTLTGSVGTVFFVYGLLSKIMHERARMAAFTVLIGLSILTHYSYSLYMGDFWSVQRQVWWQLSWRAPKVEERTVLFVNLPPEFDYGEGYEIWPPADMIYYRQAGPPPITAEVLNRETVFQIYQRQKKTKTHREIWLNNIFSNPLILSMARTGLCLNVIDGRKYELARQEDPLVRAVAGYSKINRIQVDAEFTQPPVEIFGLEPERTWCYYYQKAMVARQIGDWEAIAKLGDEAKGKGYSTGDVSEWMVFLEGYASVGREREARQLAAAIRSDEIVQYDICRQLSVAPDYPPGYAYEEVTALLCAPAAK